MIKAADLEWRMYGLVPYNISPIQQGIQFGHAVVEYANLLGDSKPYRKWSEKDKTFIILNGGTTNDERVEGGTFKGTLNNHLDHVKFMGVPYEKFCEPDLGDQLTAVVFLVDERVWNKEKYPDFVGTNGLINDDRLQPGFNEWLESIGGEQNYQLRQFLSGFRLA